MSNELLVVRANTVAIKISVCSINVAAPCQEFKAKLNIKHVYYLYDQFTKSLTYGESNPNMITGRKKLGVNSKNESISDRIKIYATPRTFYKIS